MELPTQITDRIERQRLAREAKIQELIPQAIAA